MPLETVPTPPPPHPPQGKPQKATESHVGALYAACAAGAAGITVGFLPGFLGRFRRENVIYIPKAVDVPKPMPILTPDRGDGLHVEAQQKDTMNGEVPRLYGGRYRALGVTRRPITLNDDEGLSDQE